jgi:exopolysaccharide biosynthesis glucuronosyltransferase PssD
MRKILAISSGGGHWVQLLRLRAAFDGCDVTYACVRAEYAEDVPGEHFVAYTDANRWDRWRLLKMVVQVSLLVLRLRPDVVISTGAAPGYVAIRLGRLIGARTAWIESIANAETLSMSGAMIGGHADLWLTQWAHLAKPEGPQFKGSVI